MSLLLRIWTDAVWPLSACQTQNLHADIDPGLNTDLLCGLDLPPHRHWFHTADHLPLRLAVAAQQGPGTYRPLRSELVVTKVKRTITPSCERSDIWNRLSYKSLLCCCSLCRREMCLLCHIVRLESKQDLCWFPPHCVDLGIRGLFPRTGATQMDRPVLLHLL